MLDFNFSTPASRPRPTLTTSLWLAPPFWPSSYHQWRQQDGHDSWPLFQRQQMLLQMRTVIRRRWTTVPSNAANQGRVARGFLLYPSSDIARLTSSRTQLSFEEWKFLHRSRLSILPLLGTAGVAAPDNRCRRFRADAETTSHITSHCQVNLPEIGRRHDVILEELANVICKAGHTARINKAYPGTASPPVINHAAKK